MLLNELRPRRGTVQLGYGVLRVQSWALLLAIAEGGYYVVATTAASHSGYGEAGPPPPYPLAYGSVLTFGRYKGWALNQIDAHDPNHIDWLQRTPTGRMFNAEIEAILRRRVSA